MSIEEEGRILRIQGKESYADDELMKWLRDIEVFWSYDKNKEKTGDMPPHAKLTSEKCSDGFFDVGRAMKFSNVLQILVGEAIRRNPDIFGEQAKETIDYIVSSSEAGRPFGQELARQIGTIFTYTEKNDAGEQIWKRFQIPEGAIVLQVEELITTMGTARKVRDAILKSNLHQKFRFLEINGKPVVFTLVYRPDDLSEEHPDYTVKALINREVKNYDPKDCPLCRKGSLPLKPKFGDNWQKLNQ